MEFEWKYHSFNSTYNSPFSISSSDTFTSTLTTVGDTSLSHAGQYQCTPSLITVSVSDSNTNDFDMKCKLNTSTTIEYITIVNNIVINLFYCT